MDNPHPAKPAESNIPSIPIIGNQIQMWSTSAGLAVEINTISSLPKCSQNFSRIPKANKAKSYRVGSLRSNARNALVSSKTASQSVVSLCNRPNWRATLATCRSSGINNWSGLIDLHIPKSTDFRLFRTIQRRYILSLLQVDFLYGAAICFIVLGGTSSKEKK